MKKEKEHVPFPARLALRLQEQFGDEAYKSISKGFSKTRKTTFRANMIKSSDDEIMAYLRKFNVLYARIKTIPHAYQLTKLGDKEGLALPICKEGKIYLQGISSMIPPLLLDPKPGAHVLDICAAPGSKTSQMAAMMGQKGRLVAIEKNGIRIQKLKKTLQIQGADFVEYILDDAIRRCAEFHGQFDKILADVPCSAEGRISVHNPRSFGFWSEENILKNVALQKELLNAAIPCLKPGGALVYSTCTLAPEENELMIKWVLETHKDMKLNLTPPPIPHIVTKFGYYLLPSPEHEGLFVSKLQYS